MNNGEQPYNIATIRELLLAAFTPEELRRFCQDRTHFRLCWLPSSSSQV